MLKLIRDDAQRFMAYNGIKPIIIIGTETCISLHFECFPEDFHREQEIRYQIKDTELGGYLGKVIGIKMIKGDFRYGYFLIDAE